VCNINGCVVCHIDRVEQSFVVGVLVRNTISGLCVVSRVIISVLDGLCLPNFSCFV